MGHAVLWILACSSLAAAQFDDLRPIVLDPLGGIFGAPAEAPLEEISVLEALDIGLEITLQKIREQFEPVAAFAPSHSECELCDADIPASPPREKDQSGQLLASFRRAEPESRMEAHCNGQILLQASKALVQRLRLKPSEVREQLARRSEGLDPEACRRRTEKIAGCNLPEPPLVQCSANYPYRLIDGSCNNLDNPKWGSARTPFRRMLDAAYDDGVDSMRGSDRDYEDELPSARTVSARIQKTREQKENLVTLMLMQWGQFTDHDIVHTPEAAAPEDEGEKHLECCETGHEFIYVDGVSDCQPIDVSTDPVHAQHDRVCMKFIRSLIANQGCVLGPREQLNQITAYLDGSAVYGSGDRTGDALKAHKFGWLNWTNSPEPGIGHLMPFVECEGGEGGVSGGHCFKGGDLRANEHPGLASMHTLWVRAHNEFARQLARHNPHWDDPTLYEESRRIVSALIQQITYRDFLPLVLGDARMREYDLYPLPGGFATGYDPNVDASVLNVFATAAFRFGHTLVADLLQGAARSIPLVGNFFNPAPLFEEVSRPSALLEGLAIMHAQPSDAYLVPSLTENLFRGHNDPVGMDLMALNIQRGRDHGLPGYTAWRRRCNLPAVTSFEDLTPDVMLPSVAQALRELYSTVDDIDLFPAALGEKLVPGGLLGPTFTCIIAEQFSRLKRGDRFWYENANQPKPFTEAQLDSIREIGLAHVLCQNTKIEFMQPNPFVSANMPSNRPRPCSSYPLLKAALWKENGDTPTVRPDTTTRRNPRADNTTSPDTTTSRNATTKPVKPTTRPDTTTPRNATTSPDTTTSRTTTTSPDTTPRNSTTKPVKPTTRPDTTTPADTTTSRNSTTKPDKPTV